jgi:hypothetical protein
MAAHDHVDSFVRLLPHLEDGWKYLERVLQYYSIVNSSSFQPVYLEFEQLEGGRVESNLDFSGRGKKLFLETDSIIILETLKRKVAQWVTQLFNAITSSIINCMKEKVVLAREESNVEMVVMDEIESKRIPARAKFIYSARSAVAPQSSLVVPFSSVVLASLQERDEPLYRLIRKKFQRM